MMNGLHEFTPKRPNRHKLRVNDKVKTYRILGIYKDERGEKIHHIRCEKCLRESYVKRIVGCLSCESKTSNRGLHHKIGDKIGSYTIKNIIRDEKGVPYYEVECDCGYKGTRRNLTRIGKCTACAARKKIGSKIGKLTIVDYLGHGKWRALCECGNECTVLKDGKSCGCLKLDNMKKNAEHWIGHKNNLLTITGLHEVKKGQRTLYNVKCKCGNEFIDDINHYFKVKSCGCRLHNNANRIGIGRKISPSQEAQIKELWMTGTYSQAELMEIFGISYPDLYRTLRGRSMNEAKKSRKKDDRMD